ncbi:MAG: hypothetical protein ACK47B_11385 [Armatimonadota bacterium]
MTVSPRRIVWLAFVLLTLDWFTIRPANAEIKLTTSRESFETNVLSPVKVDFELVSSTGAYRVPSGTYTHSSGVTFSGAIPGYGDYLFIIGSRFNNESTFDWGSGAILQGPSDKWGSGGGGIVVSLPENITAVGSDIMSRAVDNSSTGASFRVWVGVRNSSGEQATHGPFEVSSFRQPNRAFVGISASDEMIESLRFQAVTPGATQHVPLLDNFIAGTFSGEKIAIDAPAEIRPSILRYNGWGVDPTRVYGRRGAELMPVVIRTEPNKALRIYITPTSSSGGHAHEGTRPHGWLLLSDRRGLPRPGKNARPGTNDYSTIERAFRVNSGKSGEVTIYYVAPEISGEEVITATVSDDDGNTDQATHQVAVKVPDLISLWSDPQDGFTLYGVTNSHPENWYIAGNANVALRAAALKYRQLQENDSGTGALPALLSALADYGYDFPFNPPFGENPGGFHLPLSPEDIFVNDVSLTHGGLFDLDAGWTAQEGHKGHRTGHHLDIRSVHLYIPPQPKKGEGPKGPYRLVGRTAPNQRVLPPAEGYSQAVGDPRLSARKGLAPFRDSDTRRDASGNPVLGGDGQPLKYDAATRRKMNDLVKRVHFRRLALLIESLRVPADGVQGIFAMEGNHIHVQYD